MYKPTYHTLSKRGYITLLALLVSIITFAQGVTVKGTILDENKEPLICLLYTSDAADEELIV